MCGARQIMCVRGHCRLLLRSSATSGHCDISRGLPEKEQPNAIHSSTVHRRCQVPLSGWRKWFALCDRGSYPAIGKGTLYCRLQGSYPCQPSQSSFSTSLVRSFRGRVESAFGNGFLYWGGYPLSFLLLFVIPCYDTGSIPASDPFSAQAHRLTQDEHAWFKCSLWVSRWVS
jgi:hypothetical protein